MAVSATTRAVRGHHFDLVEAAFLEDDETRDFIADHNAPALADIADRLQEAIDRGLWTPRSNSARARIAAYARANASAFGAADDVDHKIGATGIKLSGKPGAFEIK